MSINLSLLFGFCLAALLLAYRQWRERRTKHSAGMRWVTQHAVDGIYHLPFLPRHRAGSKPEWCKECKASSARRGTVSAKDTETSAATPNGRIIS